MSTARTCQLVSTDDYLAAELASPIKHEYLGGIVYAMAGASNAHNLIASNILVAVGSRLRGKPCRAYNSDTKIRVRLANHVRFYYPDVSVICRPNPPSDSFQDEPTVLFEVLSRQTRRTDEGEKKDACLTLPALNVYALVEQDAPVVVVFRRIANGFAREVFQGLDAMVSLPEIEINLPLADIYETVDFKAEPTLSEDDDVADHSSRNG